MPEVRELRPAAALRAGRDLLDVRERAAMRAMRENRVPDRHGDALRSGLHRLHALLQGAGAVRACGTESRWLSRRKELGHDQRLCPRCARKGSHGTCAACRRHRLVEPSPGGRRLCRACREQGEIPCPECSRPMPAGCGRRCWTCYWERLARRRIRIGSAGLASPVLAKRFGEFGAWLVEKTGERKAALNVNRHLEFFQQIEHQWGDIPDYARLLQHFGAAGLRRYLSARRWMEDAGLLTVDRAAREADSDRRRIDATLDRLPAGSKARDILEEYGNRLRLRVKRDETTLRSMRLALTPAARLLDAAVARRRLPPDQRTLDAFLREAPGQASALSGFVSHLRRVHGAELTMPKRRALQLQRERRAKLLPELLAVMRESSAGGIVSKRWVQLALQYFPRPSGPRGGEARRRRPDDGRRGRRRPDRRAGLLDPLAGASRGRLDSGSGHGSDEPARSERGLRGRVVKG